MQIETIGIEGLVLIKPARFSDSRGFFSESWNKATLAKAGVVLPEFVQDNHSFSREVGTVRGLHFQAPPHAQGKLVRCGRGAIFDVAVDIRKGSPTFGKWVGKTLSFDNGEQLWIPAGFLHGFMTLEPDSEIIYKCTDHYAPECDGAVKWSSCGIAWPIDIGAPVISQKDDAAQEFGSFETPFVYEVAQ